MRVSGRRASFVRLTRCSHPLVPAKAGTQLTWHIRGIGTVAVDFRLRGNERETITRSESAQFFPGSPTTTNGAQNLGMDHWVSGGLSIICSIERRNASANER